MARVLLVDDLLPNLVSLEAALAPLGAECVSVTSGTDAIVAARDGNFALVLLDVMMPGMDGLTTARALKQIDPALPILFVTAQDELGELKHEAYSLGAVDYLVKPLDVGILRQKVAAFLEIHTRAAQQLRSAVVDAEERMRRLEVERQWTLLSDLFSVAPFGVCVVRAAEFTVELVNARFTALFGLGHAKDLRLLDLIPKNASAVEAMLREVEATGVPTSITEIEIAPSGETPRYVDVIVVPLSLTLPALRCIYCFDVTERVLAVRAAEEANTTKDTFLAMVSHELRTPLAAIVGWVSLLKSAGADKDLFPRALEVIDRNARAQARIIEDILDATRAGRGQLEIERVPVDFALAVREAVDNLALEVQKRGLSLDTRFALKEAIVRGDAARLRQVASNLLTNAMKFTPAGGKISVALEGRGESFVFSVSDSGIGIDPARLSEIFEPFHQVDMSNTRRGQGIGLGLAIVRHVVELHGGAVRASSAGLGKGATLEVELPGLANSDVHPRLASQAPPDSQPDGPLSSRRILVVEDSDDAREFFAMALRNAGADVRVAPSPDVALAIYPDFKPDLVVSDLAMPGRDGFWLLSQLRAKTEYVPTLAVSASVRSDRDTLSEDFGFDDYVPKPVSSEALVEIVVRQFTGPASGASG
jgi:signal transduction histidine kinase